MLHLLQQNFLLAEQLVFFTVGIAALGYVFYRQQRRGGRTVFVQHLSRIEQHHASANGWEFVLNFISLDGPLLGDHVFENRRAGMFHCPSPSS